MSSSSCWYGKPSQLISLNVVGLNLQGTGKSTGFFITKEIKVTIFQIKISVRTFTWRLTRTFDELKEFYMRFCDEVGLSIGSGIGRVAIETQFPRGNEGEDDVMVLVERRELMESFLQEVTAKIDYRRYKPLARLIEISENLSRVQVMGSKIVKAVRRFMGRCKLNLSLYKFYSKELLDFVCTMEYGIEVYDASVVRAPELLVLSGASAVQQHPSSGPTTPGLNNNNSCYENNPEIQVLWIDVCEEPALSRVCVAPRSKFELPKKFEDERLTHGIYLSDIAEIRRGASSFSFQCPGCRWLRPDMCLSIVGSERTLDIQFTSEEAISRFLFIDMLNLLSMQSLSMPEITLRDRHFKRINPASSVKNVKRALTPMEQLNGQKLTDLLITGIEVDEESYSPYYGAFISRKLLQYNPVERRLYLSVPCADAVIAGDSAATIAPIGVSDTDRPSFRSSFNNNNSLKRMSSVDRPSNRLDSAESYYDDERNSILSNSTVKSLLHCVSQAELSAVPVLDAVYDTEAERYSVERYSEGHLTPPPATQRKSVPSPNAGKIGESTDLPTNTSVTPAITPPAVSPAASMNNQAEGNTTGNPQLSAQQDNDLTTQNRSISVDDIAEVRPGKLSFWADGTDNVLCMSIVASESIICLPVPSAPLRDSFIRRFQAFVKMHRDVVGLDCDSPAVFKVQPHHQQLKRTPSNNSGPCAVLEPTIEEGGLDGEDDEVDDTVCHSTEGNTGIDAISANKAIEAEELPSMHQHQVANPITHVVADTADIHIVTSTPGTCTGIIQPLLDAPLDKDDCDAGEDNVTDRDSFTANDAEESRGSDAVRLSDTTFTHERNYGTYHSTGAAASTTTSTTATTNSSISTTASKSTVPSKISSTVITSSTVDGINHCLNESSVPDAFVTPPPRRRHSGGPAHTMHAFIMGQNGNGNQNSNHNSQTCHNTVQYRSVSTGDGGYVPSVVPYTAQPIYSHMVQHKPVSVLRRSTASRGGTASSAQSFAGEDLH